jgi:hypothetical protein
LHKTLPTGFPSSHVIFSHYVIVGIQDKNQIAGVGKLGMKGTVDVWVVMVLHKLKYSVAEFLRTGNIPLPHLEGSATAAAVHLAGCDFIVKRVPKKLDDAPHGQCPP